MPLIRKPAGAAPAAPPTANISSASADERWAAARQFASPTDVPALMAALEQETEPRVREAIFTSLARIGGAESARALASQIRSDDAALRTGALDALQSMTAELQQVLPGLLSDPDADVRLLACELARAAPGDDSASMLCALLEREPEANVTAAAVEVLSEIGSPQALPVLERCAARFADQPFLVFAIRIARDRIGAK